MSTDTTTLSAQGVPARDRGAAAEAAVITTTQARFGDVRSAEIRLSGTDREYVALLDEDGLEVARAEWCDDLGGCESALVDVVGWLVERRDGLGYAALPGDERRLDVLVEDVRSYDRCAARADAVRYTDRPDVTEYRATRGRTVRWESW